MAEKSAICGEYIITVEDSGAVNVYHISNNTKDSLREIAKTIGYKYDEAWNTRTLGSKLVDFVNGKNIDQTQENASASQEVEQQDSNINDEDANDQELKELCVKIKEALESQGKDSCIVISEENSDESTGDNRRSADFDEETYEEHIEGWYDEFMLCSVDCVDYSRQMRVNGVFIEDDELKFYLQEYRQFDSGCPSYYDPLEVDFEGLMNGWWIHYADDDIGLGPKSVLSNYLELITEKMPELLD